MDRGRQDVIRLLKMVARLTIDKSSQVFSKLVKAGARIDMESAEMKDITVATQEIIEQDREVISTFITLEGDAQFRFLIFLGRPEAEILATAMLRKDLSQHPQKDVYIKSAVQELGNIIASAISNVFAADLGINVRPSVPEVVFDFASTLFQELIFNCARDKDEIFIIRSRFFVVRDNILCNMYLLPECDEARFRDVLADH